MLVVTHEGRFLGHDNVVFAFRDTRTVRAVRRRLHNNDPRTFVRRHEGRYQIVRPEEPRPPLDMRSIRVETRGVGFLWQLMATGCELFVVTDTAVESHTLTLRGVHAGLPGRGDAELTVQNLVSLWEHDKCMFS